MNGVGALRTVRNEQGKCLLCIGLCVAGLFGIFLGVGIWAVMYNVGDDDVMIIGSCDTLASESYYSSSYGKCMALWQVDITLAIVQQDNSTAFQM
ncbi:hypothetical protein Pelo_18338 [Pelomyxa schiedti]|nr:hypothetical protein Pelo_18338 [Pelomyxa schiedti]